MKLNKIKVVLTGPHSERNELLLSQDVPRCVDCPTCNRGIQVEYKGIHRESCSFIKRVELENTGGGCTVDIITLDNDMVVTINDECLVVHPNMHSWYDQRTEQNCISFEEVEETEAKRIEAVKAEVLSNMAKLLENWCDSQNLEYLSASEIIGRYELTEDQVDWLNSYVKMWAISQ